MLRYCCFAGFLFESTGESVDHNDHSEDDGRSLAAVSGVVGTEGVALTVAVGVEAEDNAEVRADIDGVDVGIRNGCCILEAAGLIEFIDSFLADDEHQETVAEGGHLSTADGLAVTEGVVVIALCARLMDWFGRKVSSS